MLKESYELFELSKQETLEWYGQEIAGLRTGRVMPDLITSLSVDVYGSKTPVNGLASVSNTDARTLVVSPWDPGSAGAIVTALTNADVGAQPVVDGEVIRLAFSALTEEMREQTVKNLHRKTEEARVRLRQARDEALRKVKDAKEKSELTEDDFYEGKKKLDELIEAANKELEGQQVQKEADILAV